MQTCNPKSNAFRNVVCKLINFFPHKKIFVCMWIAVGAMKVYIATAAEVSCDIKRTKKI